MRWETIKKRAIVEAITELRSPFTNVTLLSVGAIFEMLDRDFKLKYENQTLATNMRLQLMDEVEKEINNWDIRSYLKLKEVFPKAFPKNVWGIIELGENGWEIV
jgi:hypothetical protein